MANSHTQLTQTTSKPKQNTTESMQSENRMMMIHHSKFKPQRSYDKSPSIHMKKPEIVATRLYYSYGYTSEYNISKPLLSKESISTLELCDFLHNIGRHKTHEIYSKSKDKRIDHNNNNNNNDIIYNGILHDPTLETNKEVLAMNKYNNNNNSIIERYGLTISLFKYSLSLQPKILHLTFHGEYNVNTNKSIIRFDYTPTLPLLLTTNESFKKNKRAIRYYRNYFAAIARIFEEEIVFFLSQPINKITKKPIYAKCTYINSGLIFDNKPKMIKLLQNIVHNRFQCSMTHYKNTKLIGIWYGKWAQNKTNKKLMFLQQPNKWLLEEYYLQSLCRNRQIDGICRQIKQEYKKLCRQNKKLLKKMNRKYQLFCWGIMNHCIKKIIPNEVWKWLRNLDHTKEYINNKNNNSNDSELYNAFGRTFELKIYPYVNYNRHETNVSENSNNKLINKPTEIEQKILEQRIKSIMENILKYIRQDDIISNGREYESEWLQPPLMNYKILRFKNESAIYNVKTKVIAKYKRKYKYKYVISFLELYQASAESHLLCGYIPLNGQKAYKLDVKHGRDEISQIVKKKLISREKCKIKLLLLLGCHSYHLSKIFEPYVESIICIHPNSQIDDNTCVKFSEYFYKNITLYKDKQMKLKYIVMKAFKDSINGLMKSCYSDNECKLHGHMHDINNNKRGHECKYHPNNNKFLQYSANKQNITRKDHLNELKTYKFEHPLQKYYNYPSLMIIRCDYKCYKRLKQYVMDNIFNKSQSQQHCKNNNNIRNISKTLSSVCTKRRIRPLLVTPTNNIQRGGSNNAFEYDNYEYDNNNIIPSIDAISLQRQCSEDTSSDSDDINSEIENNNNIKINKDCIISWDWYESKISSVNLSYSIIKCMNDESKDIIKQILEIKKQKEENEINIIFKKENTLGGIINEEQKEYNLGWDVCDVPICCCSIDAPHRVEDKLILLINGKQIHGRDIKLYNNNNNDLHLKKAKSLPIVEKKPLFKPLYNMNHFVTEPLCIDKPMDITEAIDDSSEDENDSYERNVLDFPIAQLTNDDDIDMQYVSSSKVDTNSDETVIE